MTRRTFFELLEVNTFELDYFRKKKEPTVSKNVDDEGGDAESNAEEKMNKKKEKGPIRVRLGDGEPNSSELAHAQAVALGTAHARTLGQLPTNVCNTDFLLGEMRAIAERWEAKVQAKGGEMSFHSLTEADMLAKGMGCIEAVARGSAMPGYVGCIDYKSPAYI